MKILVINAGSTTLKYQLIDSETEAVLAKGLCERIFLDGQIKFDHPKTGEKTVVPRKNQLVFRPVANMKDELKKI